MPAISLRPLFNTLAMLLAIGCFSGCKDILTADAPLVSLKESSVDPGLLGTWVTQRNGSKTILTITLGSSLGVMAAKFDGEEKPTTLVTTTINHVKYLSYYDKTSAGYWVFQYKLNGNSLSLNAGPGDAKSGKPEADKPGLQKIMKKLVQDGTIRGLETDNTILFDAESLKSYLDHNPTNVLFPADAELLVLQKQ